MAMTKRTTFTTISTLPPGITREVVIDFLHNHVGMIDLNPLVIERHPIPAPPHATAEERQCVWWSLTDKVSYLPGGVVSGDVTYTAAFNDLANGVQTHIYAPMNTNIRERWSLNGTLPGEPPEPVELGIGAPRQGLYLREDVDLRCNFVMSSFVKKTLKKAHGTLVEKLLAAAAAATKALPQAPITSHQHTGSSASASAHSGSAHSSTHSAYPPQYAAAAAAFQNQHSRQSTSPYSQPLVNQGQGQQGQGHGRSHSQGVSPPLPPGRESPGAGPRVSVDVGSGNGSFMPEPLRVNRNRVPSGQYAAYHQGLEVVPPRRQRDGQGQNGGAWAPPPPPPAVEKPRYGCQTQQGPARTGDGGFRAELE
ncbi:hypothetical protein F5B19DRAFT_189312 [Rostrohypoxylon terebratum]|nr:hypothetical protein F5B19DRAFT_189312 [Rostrohypoxylon terebratum]